MTSPEPVNTSELQLWGVARHHSQEAKKQHIRHERHRGHLSMTNSATTKQTCCTLSRSRHPSHPPQARVDTAHPCLYLASSLTAVLGAHAENVWSQGGAQRPGERSRSASPRAGPSVRQVSLTTGSSRPQGVVLPLLAAHISHRPS